MPKPSLDDSVMGEFQRLIASMRAKRLAGELPASDPKLNVEALAPAGDADDEQTVIEALNDSDEDDRG